MDSTLLPVGLIVYVAIGMGSIPARRVNDLLLIRFLVTEFSPAIIFLAIPLSTTLIVGTGYLVAGVSEIPSITEI